MAIYYKRDTNPTNANWNQANNWSTVSSASATNAGTFPVAGDTAILDAGSVTVTVNVASACTVLTCTGFNTNLVMSSTLTVSGACTLPSGASGALTGSSALILSGTQTLTTNGQTIPALTSTTASSVKTLVGNLTVTNFTVTNNTTFNGNKIITTGTVVFTGNCAGTTTIEFQTGTTLVGGAGICTTPFIFNGNVTWSGTVAVGAMTWTYTSGTITATSGTLSITAPNVNLTGWGTNVVLGTLNTTSTNSVTTVTPSLDLYVGTITASSNTYLTISHATSKVYISGGLPLTGSFQLNGTCENVMNGTGTINNNTIVFFAPLVINTSGTITLGSLAIKKSFKYVAGSITLTGSQVLNTTGNISLDMAGMPARIGIAQQTSGTVTLLSNCVCGTISPNTNITLTLAGAFDVDCTTLRIGVGSTIYVTAGQTMQVNTNLQITGTAIATATFGHPSSTVYLNYLGTMADNKVAFATISNVDATPTTIPIYTWYGTVTSCTNVYEVTGADIGGAGLTLTII